MYAFTIDRQSCAMAPELPASPYRANLIGFSRLRNRGNPIRLCITMNATTPLIEEIDGFLAETGMAETTFGQKAVRDWRLMERLRSGGSVTLTTAAKLRNFMRDYRKPKAA